MNTDEIGETKIVAVRLQLEFYFGEGNLPRDKFMLEYIDKSISKAVPIDALLTFNRLRSLEATEEDVLRAASGSDVVEVDEEGSGIRRKSALPKIKSPEGRTLYVAGGGNSSETAENIDNRLRTILGSIGTITRVDVPRYPSSNTPRGFAFVEYLTKTSFKAALKLHKPSELEVRKAAAWKYFSYSNSQYNHALKQLEMLGHPQKLFFEDFLGEQRKLKVQDKLIVISKKEWLIFRSQFYEAQKAHLLEMKSLINKYQNKQAVKNSCSHKLHERVKAEEAVISKDKVVIICKPESPVSNSVISKSIVEFHCEEGSTKKTVKTSLTLSNALNNVAYIDFKDFNLSGFFRFKSSETTIEFIKNAQGFLSVRILSQTEEQEYIDRITNDKEMKRESQKRKNQKKKNKIASGSVDCKKQKTE